jgi:hypothetical protein
MEPKSSVLRLQETATGPDPESDESSSHPPSLFPQDPFEYYLSIYA